MPHVTRQVFCKRVKPAGHKVWVCSPLSADDYGKLAHPQLEEVRFHQCLPIWPCRNVHPTLPTFLTFHKKL